ncbi:unnamed protein product [Chrysodeixis includens]|uniref:Uncharacterized protein n=1 Tax=Chrysodeixis includens TaxID=689277 RepID=A0A9N8KZH1_CHRIL|nr:unnamed protein product [Chrysodeixis includens]
MIHKIAILSGLVLSATCMVLHQPQHLLLGLQYHDEPNYNFAYEYSLLQPDGVRRTVDYRSDDHTGFQASVNNDGRPVNQYSQNGNNDVTRHPNLAVPGYQGWPTPSAPHPTQAAVPFVALLALVAAVQASDLSSFSYSVADPYTGDFKHQIENRVDNNVAGQYSLLESDGTRRTVDYAAGAEGFNAVVRKDPAVIAPAISYAAPAIAAPAISYAAPAIAPISYAARIAAPYGIAAPFPYARYY